MYTTHARFVHTVTVTDPDTQGDVDIEIYKTAGGGLVGIDASFLAQENGPVYCPFDENTLLVLLCEEGSEIA